MLIIILVIRAIINGIQEIIFFWKAFSNSVFNIMITYIQIYIFDKVLYYENTIEQVIRHKSNDFIFINLIQSF